MSRYYLLEHPNPNKTQYRAGRRATATGAIVIHTAENTTDVVLPDHGAEGVARFISRRNSYGSYHDLVDSDSHVPMAPYDYEVWGVGPKGPAGTRLEGVRANSVALHLSFACQADQWGTQALPPGWVEAALLNGAQAAAAMADWIHDLRGFKVPARRITAAEFWAGAAGFISHGELDPGRRHDPGNGFPWDRFLQNCVDTGRFHGAAPKPDPSASFVSRIQKASTDARYSPTGDLDQLASNIEDISAGLMRALAANEELNSANARLAATVIRAGNVIDAGLSNIRTVLAEIEAQAQEAMQE